MRDAKAEEKRNTQWETQMDSLVELLNVNPHSDWLPEGLLITNINFKKRFTGTMIIVKAMKRGSEPVICFKTTLDVFAACHTLRRDIADGTQMWKRDKWGEQFLAENDES